MKGMEVARKIIFFLCSVCFAGCCIFLIAWFINGQLVKARNRELATRFQVAEHVGAKSDQNGSDGTAQSDIGQKMDALRRENEDTAGWIYIDGAGVDYPVVQSADNEYYLNRNFWKQEDRYGAIFMDCANTDGFASQHVILYGHNMQDGAMFGGLIRYLEADYLDANPVIAVVLPDGNMVSYRIFAARKAYANDSAYRLDFADASEFEAFAAELGASDTPAQLLTLSTCTNGRDDRERILIHAVPEFMPNTV